MRTFAVALLSAATTYVLLGAATPTTPDPAPVAAAATPVAVEDSRCMLPADTLVCAPQRDPLGNPLVMMTADGHAWYAGDQAQWTGDQWVQGLAQSV